MTRKAAIALLAICVLLLIEMQVQCVLAAADSGPARELRK
jgi:hypothetical protein